MADGSGRAARVATAVGVADAGLLVASAVLLLQSGGAPRPETLWIPGGLDLLLPSALVGMGWLLAVRRPENPVSWSLFAAGTFGAVQSVLIAGTVLAHDRGWHDLGRWSALGVEILWPGVVVGLLHALGRFPGDRWDRRQRAMPALAVVAWSGLTLTELLLAGPFQNVGWYANPLGVVPREAEDALGVVYLPFIVLAVTAAWAFIGGFRSSQGVQRQQFRWVAASAAPFVLVMLVVPFAVGGEGVSTTDPVVVLSMIAMTLLPVGMAVAIVRYRLYDLDRLVSRTVAWTLLTGLVVGVWAAVALLPSALAGGGEVHPALVALATAVAAAAFNPLRVRLQDLVDRRLHRERYDATREVEQLGGQLAEEVTANAVAAHVLRALQRTVGPTTAALWLRQDGTSR